MGAAQQNGTGRGHMALAMTAPPFDLQRAPSRSIAGRLSAIVIVFSSV